MVIYASESMSGANVVAEMSPRSRAFCVDQLIANSNQLPDATRVNAGSIGADLAGIKDEREATRFVEPPYASLLSCGSDEMRTVGCDLQGRDLWRQFDRRGTEMIITKSGRRLFPTLRVQFVGLHSDQLYDIYMDIVRADGNRYRYVYHRAAWVIAGRADPATPARLVQQHDSPMFGSKLAKMIVSFEKVKLTNNPLDNHNHTVVLQSMHKYQPRLHIALHDNDEAAPASATDLSAFVHRTFIFPEISFTAVTAYQNHMITKLKIDNNPFAKGFRESARLYHNVDRPALFLPLRPLPLHRRSGCGDYSHAWAAVSNLVPDLQWRHNYAFPVVYPPVVETDGEADEY